MAIWKVNGNFVLEILTEIGWELTMMKEVDKI